MNGTKASTTGTVYGVYDMAGGSVEYVAGCINGQENAKFGVTTGDTTYVDLYTGTSNSSSNYNGAKTGDATKETKGWSSDIAYFVYSPNNSVFVRGHSSVGGVYAGVFSFSSSAGAPDGNNRFPCGVSPISDLYTL